MRFKSGSRNWWQRESTAQEHSLDARWLPLLGLAGVLTALVFLPWRSAPNTVAAPEDIAAAASDSGPADFHQLPAIEIRLRANAAGNLASITLNSQPVKNLDDLRGQIRTFLGSAAADGTVEAELDCDGRLRYEHTQRIVAAISVCPAADGRTMVPMVDRIKFSPRQN